MCSFPAADEAKQPPPTERPTQRAVVCALCNQKGGVGKTTSTINLARAASVLGQRVLVVDADYQGNSTTTLSRYELSEDTAGIADVLTPRAKERAPIDEVIVPGIWDGVELVPSPSADVLDEVTEQISAMKTGREKQLTKALTPVLDRYDLVLIDNNPSLGVLLINALAAAHVALIITQPERWAIDGLAKLHDTIDLVVAENNPNLRTVGPLVNQRDPRANAHRDVLGELGEFYGPSAWTGDVGTGGPVRLDGTSVDEGAVIPQRAAVRDYPVGGLGLDQHPRMWAQDIAARYGWVVQQILRVGGGGRR